MGRIYAIPDIHGRLDLAVALYDKLYMEEGLRLDEGDKLIFLGDYVDRGPDSRGVIDMVRALATNFPESVVALAGNHEWLMIDGVTRGGGNRDLWYMNGGHATVVNYPGHGEIEADANWLATLPLFHEEPGFFFSHAPILAEKKRPRHLQHKPLTKEDYIWSYDDNEGHCFRKEEGRVGVCGHIHQIRRQLYKQEPLAPRLYPEYIFADAGAGCHTHAPLVAIEVISRKVIYAHPVEAQTTQS